MNFNMNIVNSPNSGTKLIFIVHFVVIVFVLQASPFPISYLLYNTFFLLALFWSLAHKELEEPLFFAVVINVLSILFDIILIGLYFHYYTNTWSALNAILLLIIRPISTILLIRYYNERTDSTINIPGFTTSNNGRSGYESIDQNGQNA